MAARVPPDHRYRSPHHRAPTTAPCTALGGSTSGNHGRPGAVSGHGLACQLELVQDGDEEKNVEGDDKEDHGEDDDEEDHGEDDDQIFNFFMNIDDFSLTFLSPFSHPSLTSLSPPSHLPLTFPSSPLTLLSETSQGLPKPTRGGSLASAHACRPLDMTPPDNLAPG